MQLTYAQLEQTLSAHLRIQPDKLPTFRSRIKQLQRLEFPSGVNVGRGARMEYSAEHLLKLATVFELLNFGLPAQAACQIVNEHWQLWSAGYALAAINDRSKTSHEDEARRIFAVLDINSLHEIQFHKYGRLKPSKLEIFDRGWLRIKIEGEPFKSEWSHLVMPLDQILDNVLRLALEVAGVKGAGTWSKDFNAWLPKGVLPGINFTGDYPDLSNLEMRKHVNQFRGNDPDIGSPEDLERINEFIANNYSFNRYEF